MLSNEPLLICGEDVPESRFNDQSRSTALQAVHFKESRFNLRTVWIERYRSTQDRYTAGPKHRRFTTQGSERKLERSRLPCVWWLVTQKGTAHCTSGPFGSSNR